MQVLNWEPDGSLTDTHENERSLGVIRKLGMQFWEDRAFAGLNVAMFRLSRQASQATWPGPVAPFPAPL